MSIEPTPVAEVFADIAQVAETMQETPAKAVADASEEISDAVTEDAENFVEEVEAVVEEMQDTFSPLSDQMAMEETIEEFFNEEEV